MENIPSRCNNYCTMESKCVSFNISPPIKDVVLCQLNDADHIQHPKDLQAQEGFMYRGTEVRKSHGSLYFCFIYWLNLEYQSFVSKIWRFSQNSCVSTPCLHNATCLGGYTARGYVCECQDGYSGEQCEKGRVKEDGLYCFLRVKCTQYSFVTKCNLTYFVTNIYNKLK